MEVSPAQTPPPAAARTNAQLNLSVLQRYKPSIVHVLSIAPYTVIYTFSTSTQTWEKAGIEGTLFVVQLSGASEDAHAHPQHKRQHQQERYSVFVLNRRGLDNFELELQSADDVEITDDYIILQHTDLGVIYGLWVFAEPPPSSTAEMRSVNAKVIQDCAARAEASRAAAAADQSGLPGKGQQQYAQQQQQQQRRPPPPQQTTSWAGPAQSPSAGEASGQSMARQLSLRELFGQPQAQQQHTSNLAQGYDSDYYDGPPLQQHQPFQHQYPQQYHQQQQQQPQQQQQQQQRPPPQFQQGFYNNSPAFRLPPQQQNNQYPPPPQPQPQPQPSLSQQDVLGSLFQRARQGYNYT